MKSIPSHYLASLQAQLDQCEHRLQQARSRARLARTAEVLSDARLAIEKETGAREALRDNLRRTQRGGAA